MDDYPAPTRAQAHYAAVHPHGIRTQRGHVLVTTERTEYSDRNSWSFGPVQSLVVLRH